jgi:hypothetical protein
MHSDPTLMLYHLQCQRHLPLEATKRLGNPRLLAALRIVDPFFLKIQALIDQGDPAIAA